MDGGEPRAFVSGYASFEPPPNHPDYPAAQWPGSQGGSGEQARSAVINFVQSPGLTSKMEDLHVLKLKEDNEKLYKQVIDAFVQKEP